MKAKLYLKVIVISLIQLLGTIVADGIQLIYNRKLFYALNVHYKKRM